MCVREREKEREREGCVCVCVCVCVCHSCVSQWHAFLSLSPCSFPNKQKSSDSSAAAMTTALGSNLSELDRLLLELNAVQNTPGFPTDGNTHTHTHTHTHMHSSPHTHMNTLKVTSHHTLFQLPAHATFLLRLSALCAWGIFSSL